MSVIFSSSRSCIQELNIRARAFGSVMGLVSFGSSKRRFFSLRLQALAISLGVLSTRGVLASVLGGVLSSTVCRVKKRRIISSSAYTSSLVHIVRMVLASIHMRIAFGIFGIVSSRSTDEL